MPQLRALVFWVASAAAPLRAAARAGRHFSSGTAGSSSQHAIFGVRYETSLGFRPDNDMPSNLTLEKFMVDAGARFDRKLTELGIASSLAGMPPRLARGFVELEDWLSSTLVEVSATSWTRDWRGWAGVFMMSAGLVWLAISSVCLRTPDLRADAPDRHNVGMFVLFAGMDLAVLCSVCHGGIRAVISCISTIIFLLLVAAHVVFLLFAKHGFQVSYFTASNVYLNFRAPLSQVFVTALAQLVFFLMYASVACSVEEEHFSCFYWLITLFTVQMWMGSSLPLALGEFYGHKKRVWMTLLWHPSVMLTSADNDEPVMVGRHRIMASWLLAVFFNGVVFLFVGLTVPLSLSQSANPLDYVMNSFGLVFICTLDDCDVPVDFAIHMHGSEVANTDDTSSTLRCEKFAVD